ncbi:MAG: hypothetical protein IK016_07670, partial [Lachnospiraceae bacterium]|nr:hypothetical protein [Lachnospiraceae bacterium]
RNNKLDTPLAPLARMRKREASAWSVENLEEVRSSDTCLRACPGVVHLKDTYVTQIIPSSVRKESERFDQLPYPEYIWFPRGIRIDCDGLNYENVPQLFSEYEVKTIDGNSRIRTEDGLYWNPGTLSYGVYMSAEDDRGISVSMTFSIDSETKEVSGFNFSTFGLGDEGLTITNEVRIEYDIKNHRSGWAESYWFD